VAVDGFGNVFVTGSATVDLFGDTECATIKYSSAGEPLWTNRYNDGIAFWPGQANALAVDSSGNVVVTGKSEGSGTLTDYATVKYSSAGVPLWTNRYNGPENRYDEPVAVAVDGNGNVVVTGFSGLGNGAYNTIKYSAAGRAVMDQSLRPRQISSRPGRGQQRQRGRDGFFGWPRHL
jgi:hypothetical protein